MNVLQNKKIALIIGLFVFFVIPLSVAAQNPPQTSSDNYGLNTTKSAAGLPDLADNNVSSIIGKVVGIALSFLGVLFFGLMIYGGFIWMMARGNSQEVEKAKDIVIGAVIGLVIVLAAYAITSFVGGSLGI